MVGALAVLQVNQMLSTRAERSRTEGLFEKARTVQRPNAESLSVPTDFSEAASRIMPSVVAVDTVTQQQNWFGETVESGGEGSGVIISEDGYVLTNNHVIERATVIQVHLSDGRSVDAKLVGRDPRSDLAVLKITAKDLQPARMGRSGSLKIGQWVIAVGNPLGYENTVSVGVVSSLDRTLPTQSSVIVNAIQTDAAINQGNSGGALANDQGELVGINTAIASPSGGSVGIGFAIPIDRAQRIVEDLIKFGRARYGYLGVNSQPTPGILNNARFRESYQSEMGVEPPRKGVFITQVDPQGPAGQAGMKQYDILLSIDGKPMDDVLDFQKFMTDKSPGDQVKIEFWSKGQTRTATVTLIDLKIF